MGQESQILTVSEVAEMLRMSPSQIYEQTRKRARVRQSLPIPFIRVNGNLRFLKSDVEDWLRQLAEYERSERALH